MHNLDDLVETILDRLNLWCFDFRLWRLNYLERESLFVLTQRDGCILIWTDIALEQDGGLHKHALLEHRSLALLEDFHSLVALLPLFVYLFFFRSRRIFVPNDKSLFNQVNVVALFVLVFFSRSVAADSIFIFNVFALKLG